MLRPQVSKNIPDYASVVPPVRAAMKAYLEKHVDEYQTLQILEEQLIVSEKALRAEVNAFRIQRERQRARQLAGHLSGTEPSTDAWLTRKRSLAQAVTSWFRRTKYDA